MITSDYFSIANSVESRALTTYELNSFLCEKIPDGFEGDEKKLYIKIMDNVKFYHIFTVKNNVPIYHGLLHQHFLDLFLNKDDFRLKLRGTTFDNINILSIINKAFRYAYIDACQVQTNIYYK